MAPSPRNLVMIGPFGLRPRTTMRVRALPLAKALVRRGYSVTILLPPWQNPEDAGRVWDDEGVRVENMSLPHGVPGWFHAQLTARLVRRTRALAPDLVHTFKPKAYAGLAHVALRRRYPVVVDTDDWEGPGGWNLQGDYPPAMQRFFTWQERWGLRRANAVTVASRALQTLAWSMGGAPERVFYLPNGVRLTLPPSEPHPSRRPTILLYTRFFEYDLDRLWRIVAEVRRSQPSARLLVVGQGFAGEESRLLQKALNAGWYAVRSSIDLPKADFLYAGWGTEDILPWAFAVSDVGIYPFDDTLLNRTKCPMKLMDLLAAGIPVVADDVGQISEMIHHQETGLLVTRGDAHAFAQAILSLLAEGDRRCRMGNAAADDVRTRYGWERLAATADAAYRYAVAARASQTT